MGEIWIREFVGGLDLRRLPESTPGGALIRAYDCHINSGGEVEQRAPFVKVYQSPPDQTTGLAASDKAVYLFGTQASAPAGLPAPLTYYKLDAPESGGIIDVMDAESFGNDFIVVAIASDTSRWVYRNGTLLTHPQSPPTLAGSGSPTAVRTLGQKLLVGAGTKLHFSAIRNAADFSGTGAGSIDTAFEASRTYKVAVWAISRYGDYAVLFLNEDIMLWSLGADPAASKLVRSIAGVGCASPRGVASFNEDLIFVNKTGIRSLRARGISDTATAADIGSPIDRLVGATYRNVSSTSRRRACVIVEPTEDRVWVSLGDQIFVLSYYPENKISAWSVYRPGFGVHSMAVLGDKVYLRDTADGIYVYGGTGATPVYDNTVTAEVYLPYLDGGRPTQKKSVTGLSCATRGSWELALGCDPRSTSTEDVVARVVNHTYDDPILPASISGTHVSLRARSTAPASSSAPAVFSSAVIVHDLEDS